MGGNGVRVKLVVQIPCLNEEKTLGQVIRSIPDRVPGFSSVEIVVIDDGSTDGTAEVAHNSGASKVIRHRNTRGLAEAFRSGVNHALAVKADVLVNTDGDDQYPQAEIPRLVEPIVNGEADIVVGDRRTHTIPHFSRTKKALQKIGSAVVNRAAGTRIPDAASGFRAYSRDALIRLNLVTKFSYTMETIIQAGYKRMAIQSVRVKTNPKTRDSRLFKSTAEHVLKSSMAIIRSFLMYRPYSLFGSVGLVLLVAGLFPFVRFLALLLLGVPAELIQSLLLGVFLLTASLLSLALGVIADLIRINRQLIEDGLAIQKTQSNSLHA